MLDYFLGMAEKYWMYIFIVLESLYLIFDFYIRQRLHKIIDLSFVAFKKCQEIRQSNVADNTQAWQDFDRLVEEIVKENEKVTKIEDKLGAG